MDPLRPYLHHLLLSVTALGGWLVLLGLIFIPIERLFALRPSKIFRRAFLTDLGYFFINGIIPGLALSIPLGFAAWAGRRILPDAWPQAFAHWPIGLRLVTALVIAEFGLYWGHRWCHEIPLLWRFHAVHHSPTHVDWLVNSRGHPLDFVFTRLCGLLPLYMLGLGSPLEGDPGAIPIIVMLVGPAWGFFIHANVRWRFGPLEWLIATPAFHHWHHTNDGAAVINKNYAPMWPWIDRLFGTLHLPPDRQPVDYGTNLPVAAKLTGQLLDPFVRPLPSSKPSLAESSGR